jgi:hypothetical protein
MPANPLNLLQATAATWKVEREHADDAQAELAEADKEAARTNEFQARPALPSYVYSDFLYSPPYACSAEPRTSSLSLGFLLDVSWLPCGHVQLFCYMTEFCPVGACWGLANPPGLRWWNTAP